MKSRLDLSLRLFRAALEGADPFHGVMRRLRLRGNELEVKGAKGVRRWDLKRFREIIVLGAGKAASSMGAACEERFRDRLTGGLIVVPYGYGAAFSRITCIEAGHPIPDRSGWRAGKRILSLLKKASAETLIVFLTSGGCSSLYLLPVPPLTLKDKQRISGLLLASGASIEELNAVRKHLSQVKGGWSAGWAHPATVINLVLSDVIGDALEVIGSGPFSPDPSTFEDVWKIFKKYGLISKAPPSVLGHIRKGMRGYLPETPKKGDPRFSRVCSCLIGSNRSALEEARKKAVSLGWKTLFLSTEMRGDVRALAQFYGALLRERLRRQGPSERPLCILAGGEPTVIVKGRGIGGRNTELTLAVAREIRGLKGVFFLSVGTDGRDGPTDAAGAWVDGRTWLKAIKKGLDPQRFLEENDSYTFFQETGGLIRTGPTGTNVMDIHIGLIH